LLWGPLFVGLEGPEHDEDADEGAAEGGYLGVGHGVAEVELGVDADEFHEETAKAAEYQVEARQPADWLVLLA